MFCSTCGESLQVSFKFCPKCGKDLANNNEIKVRDETSGKKNLSFKEFKETKEKQRATFFRKKPGRGKGNGKQQEDLSDTVKINIGIMVPDSVQLRRVRGKSLTVKVPKNATASMLLEAGAEKHKAHSKDIIKQEYNYVLLYEDCTEVKTLKESSEAFVLYKYKNECGKPYHKLNFFLCEALEFTQTTLERFIESNPESTLSSEENNEEDIVEQVHVKRIKRAKLSSVFEEDSEDDLPSMLSSAGASTTTLNFSTEVASTARAQPDCNLKTLKDIFPNREEHLLRAALDKTNDINLAISEIIERSSFSPVPELSSHDIYASLNFRTDITGDTEFEDNNMDITFGPTTCTSTTQDNEDGAFEKSLRKLATEKVQRDKPLRIKVRRRNIWEDSKVKLAKYTESDLNNIIKVQFVGEPAVDQGGPRNEFFSLLHREVCGSNMFIGSETCKLFNHNLLALEQGNYFIYGQLCSLAIMQGSLAPSFLSPTLADYIVFGELGRAQSRIDDVFDKEVRDKLKELKIIEDPEEFKRVASFECALRFDAGFCKPIVTIEDKVKMLHIITLHYTLLQSLAEVNQFIEGLKLNGLLECMRQHPYEARKLFIYENNQISGEELDDLLVPLFSEPGSNKRELQERVSFNFTRYLEDVNDAKVKGTIEDFDTAEKSHIVITAGMVLQFITGSYQVPALKFDPVPSLKFLHDDPGRKMNANTCSNTLTLPVHSKYLDYNLFQEEFTTCILDSPGFGNV